MHKMQLRRLRIRRFYFPAKLNHSSEHSLKLNLFAYIKTDSYLGLHSLSERTSYCKMWWGLEAVRFEFKLFRSLWNLTSASAVGCLSNFGAIWVLCHPISGLRDFTWSCGETYYHLVNRCLGCISRSIDAKIIKTNGDQYIKRKYL